MTNHEQVLTDYLAAFIEELVQAGVKEAIISPGSRSTPLALMMAEHPILKIYVDVDERSAGFFALGLAKASKRPVVLLCTSGTAAANYFPAVAEANLSQIPLIVLTADRPHELRNVGAPQAMDQLHLYGSHVK
ncbi:2-succinyl-5-enolpyruvyl-6-hydroxy-3-cyclohexene-1-carboxylic-acid synthase, partial [Listeria monocytogenes]|nr:2-succinyl-5-enolpyruvyl-6-hydroxy-3-cyclohexene-1-carboxylic-acid synthase [Listeria monocytogenes]